MFHFYLWLVFQSKSVLPKVIFIYHHEKHLITMITTIHHLVEESITHITPNWQNTCKNNWNHFPLLIELSYDLESWCQTLLLLASQYHIWRSFGGDQQSITKSKRTLVLLLSCCQKKKKIMEETKMMIRSLAWRFPRQRMAGTSGQTGKRHFRTGLLCTDLKSNWIEFNSNKTFGSVLL